MRHTLLPSRSFAFTLIESLMASVVLSLTVLGVSGMLITATTQTVSLQDDHIATSLATQLMESISRLPLTDAAAPDVAGWSANNKTTSTYDNLVDYNGYTDYFAVQTGVSGSGGKPLVSPTAVDTAYLTANGITFPTAGNSRAKVYRRVASFQYRTSPAGSAAVTGPFGLVTVTVTTNRGDAAVVLTRLFSDVSMQ